MGAPAETVAFAIVILSFVAPLEIASAIFGFLSRDTGAATAMGIFGTGWVAIALYYLMLGTAAHTVTLGVFLIMNSFATLALAVSAVNGKRLLEAVLFFSTARFALAALTQFGFEGDVPIAAGAIGLLLGALAIYAGVAVLIDESRHDTLLPIFRSGAAKKSVERGLSDQTEHVHGEPGVRQHL